MPGIYTGGWTPTTLYFRVQEICTWYETQVFNQPAYSPEKKQTNMEAEHHCEMTRNVIISHPPPFSNFQPIH